MGIPRVFNPGFVLGLLFSLPGYLSYFVLQLYYSLSWLILGLYSLSGRILYCDVHHMCGYIETFTFSALSQPVSVLSNAYLVDYDSL